MASGGERPKPDDLSRPPDPEDGGVRFEGGAGSPARAARFERGAGSPAGAARFKRGVGSAADPFTYIGRGKPGGKAAGLAFANESLCRAFPQGCFDEIRVSIPRMTVLLTGVFEEFLALNKLVPAALTELEDERIAHLFQKADLPPTVVGDLLSLIASVHEPLAIRSSSLLEDALCAPFAGVYTTKMIPNNQPEADARFRRLVEAIKLVYASTYFRAARQYFRSIDRDIRDERMAVIIQEVVGYRFGERYYPTLSGVARSYNFYPTGNASPAEGVVNLALGLGKTIVDGGRVWSYCPAFPQAPPPYATLRDLLKNTQTRFWSVFMGTPKEYDPLRETEYLHDGSLEDAEEDGTLEYLCSTYDPSSDRLQMGAVTRGPRLVDFSPLLKGRIAPINELLKKLLALAEENSGEAVEIEFALAFDPRRKRETRFGFLQVRPMVAASSGGTVELDEIHGRKVLLTSERAMGNGILENLRDILYVRPGLFRAEATRRIAEQVDRANSALQEEGTPYVLIGIGRWGSADPWLGIPVRWSQISGAKVVVETTLAEMYPDLSQGSHFFHNMSSLGVLYLCVPNPESRPIDWEWLERQPVMAETEFLRHARCPDPILVMVDGRNGRGLILE
jgi:hypothetical protein